MTPSEVARLRALCEAATPGELAGPDLPKRYAPGSILYWVRLSGEVVCGNDKMAATKRTALWRIDATRAVRLFGCDVAELALLSERAAGRDPDPRSWEAIRMTRLWIDGQATDEEQSAAWNAAESAAWSAAEKMLIKRIRGHDVGCEAARASLRSAP